MDRAPRGQRDSAMLVLTRRERRADRAVARTLGRRKHRAVDTRRWARLWAAAHGDPAAAALVTRRLHDVDDRTGPDSPTSTVAADMRPLAVLLRAQAVTAAPLDETTPPPTPLQLLDLVTVAPATAGPRVLARAAA